MNPIEILERHCIFENNYDCYVLMAISRKKTNDFISSGKEIVFRDIIKRKEDITKRYLQMKARTINYKDEKGQRYSFYVYISVNPRDARKAAFSLMTRINSWILEELNGANDGKMYKRIDKAFYSELMKKQNKGKLKRFIIDYDSENDLDTFKMELHSFGVKILMIQESRNGYHIVTEPFNIKLWADKGLVVYFEHEVLTDANLFIEYVGVKK